MITVVLQPDGEIDLSYEKGNLRRNLRGQVIGIDQVEIQRNLKGQITCVGRAEIQRNLQGKIIKIGNTRIERDLQGRIMKVVGNTGDSRVTISVTIPDD